MIIGAIPAPACSLKVCTLFYTVKRIEIYVSGNSGLALETVKSDDGSMGVKRLNICEKGLTIFCERPVITHASLRIDPPLHTIGCRKPGRKRRRELPWLLTSRVSAVSAVRRKHCHLQTPYGRVHGPGGGTGRGGVGSRDAIRQGDILQPAHHRNRATQN